MALLIPDTREGAVPSGVAVPAAPFVGDLYMHTPPNRNVLLQYSGAAWYPIRTHGACNLYVDGALGTDDPDNGFGAGVDAFRTIQYAVNSVPLEGDTAPSIFIAAGNYNENVVFDGKRSRSIYLYGTWTTVASLVATGGSRGAAGANPANITGAFVAGAHDEKMVMFTSGANNGLYRIVGQTTAGALYLVGEQLPANPVVGDTYDILDWGTVINGSLEFRHYMTGAMASDLAVNGLLGRAYGTSVWGQSSVTLTQCRFVSSGAGTVLTIGEAASTVTSCLIKVTVPGINAGVEVENLGDMVMNSCKIVGAGDSYGINHYCKAPAFVRLACEISGFDSGIFLRQNSFCVLWTPTVYTYIHGCITYGIRAQSGGRGEFTTMLQYGTRLDGSADPNGTNSSAHAASYGYLGP